jgi:hypothetical protein
VCEWNRKLQLQSSQKSVISCIEFRRCSLIRFVTGDNRSRCGAIAFNCKQNKSRNCCANTHNGFAATSSLNPATRLTTNCWIPPQLVAASNCRHRCCYRVVFVGIVGRETPQRSTRLMSLWLRNFLEFSREINREISCDQLTTQLIKWRSRRDYFKLPLDFNLHCGNSPALLGVSRLAQTITRVMGNCLRLIERWMETPAVKRPWFDCGETVLWPQSRAPTWRSLGSRFMTFSSSFDLRCS